MLTITSPFYAGRINHGLFKLLYTGFECIKILGNPPYQNDNPKVRPALRSNNLTRFYCSVEFNNLNKTDAVFFMSTLHNKNSLNFSSIKEIARDLSVFYKEIAGCFYGKFWYGAIKLFSLQITRNLGRSNVYYYRY